MISYQSCSLLDEMRFQVKLMDRGCDRGVAKVHRRPPG